MNITGDTLNIPIRNNDLKKWIISTNCDVEAILLSIMNGISVPNLINPCGVQSVCTELPERSWLSHSDSINIIENIFQNSLQKYHDQQNQNDINHFCQLKNDLIQNVTNVLNTTYQKSQENSTIKGTIAEKKLYQILLTLFPNCEIYDNSSIGHSGDFSIKFSEELQILIECKCYQRNVPKVEIDKFIRDSLSKGQSAVLFSMESGVASKDNWEINILDQSKGIIILFVHNVDFDQNRILASVNLIKNLSIFMKNQIKNYDQETQGVSTTNQLCISYELLQNITDEYSEFNEKLNKSKKIIKDFSKTILDQLNTYELPKIEQLLIQAGVEGAIKKKNNKKHPPPGAKAVESPPNCSLDRRPAVDLIPPPSGADGTASKIVPLEKHYCDVTGCTNFYQSKKALIAHKRKKHPQN